MEMTGRLHAPAALPQEIDTWYPLNRRLGEPQSLSGCCGEKNNLVYAGSQTPAAEPPARGYTYWAKYLHYIFWT
jgi:hypothetical protein